MNLPELRFGNARNSRTNPSRAFPAAPLGRLLALFERGGAAPFLLPLLLSALRQLTSYFTWINPHLLPSPSK